MCKQGESKNQATTIRRVLVIRPQPGKHINWWMCVKLIEGADDEDLFRAADGIYTTGNLTYIRKALLEAVDSLASRSSLSPDGAVAAETRKEERACEVLRSWMPLRASGGEVVEVDDPGQA